MLAHTAVPCGLLQDLTSLPILMRINPETLQATWKMTEPQDRLCPDHCLEETPLKLKDPCSKRRQAGSNPTLFEPFYIFGRIFFFFTVAGIWKP